MKRLFLLSFLFAAVSAASAQHMGIPPYTAKPRLSVGAEFTLPTGDFGKVFTIGFGGSGKVEIPLTRYLYGTATAGFITYYLKPEVKDLSINKSYIPLKAGAKYYFGGYFYGEGELGASIGANKNAGTSFAWAPGAGVSFPITKDGYLDAGIRYEKWARQGGDINQVGFRVAYKF